MNLKDAATSKLAAGAAALFNVARHTRVNVKTEGGHLKVTVDIPLRDFGKA